MAIDPKEIAASEPIETELFSEKPLELWGEYWRWCPRCSRELQNAKCKLRCPQCHYFMSCSDFD